MRRAAVIWCLVALLALAVACDDLNTGDDPVARTKPEDVEQAGAPKILPGRLQLFVERQQVPVCDRPFGLALAPDGGTVFVACAGSGQVMALDTEFFDARWTSPAGFERLYKLLPDPARPRLYVIGINGAHLHALETTTGATVDTLNLGGPVADLVLAPSLDRLLVTITEPPQALSIDLATWRIVGRIEFPTPPGPLAVRGDGALAAAAGGVWQRLVKRTRPLQDPVYLFNPQQMSAPPVDLGLGGTQARQPVFAEAGTLLLVPERTSNTIAAFDVADNRLVRTIQVGAAPEKLVVTPNGRWAFSLDTRGASVTRIDLRRKQASGHVVFPSNPQDLVVAPDGNHLYVALAGVKTGEVAIVDVEQVFVRDRLRVGRDPCAMVFSHGGRKLIVSNFLSNTLSILE